MAERAEDPRAQRRRQRWIAAIVLAASLGLLLFAHVLDAEPSPSGRQTTLATFGFPGCGFQQATGLPCMSCGMTRAFSYMAHGDVAASFNMQPAGALLALGVAMLGIVAAWCVVTGMAMGPLMSAVWRPRNVLIGVLLLVAVWGLNIARTLGA